MANYSSSENCTVYVETAAENFSKFIKDPWPLVLVPAIGAVLLLVALLIYVEEVVFVFRHVHVSDLNRRKKLVLLMGLCPAICTCCFIAVLVPRSRIVVDILIALCVSFCLHMFMQLIVDYYGGADNLVKIVENRKMSLRSPPACCCCCCLPTVQINRKKIFRMHGLVLQMMVIRPLLMIIAAIFVLERAYIAGMMLPGSPYTYLNVINVISTLFGVYGMLLILKLVAPDLKEFLIVPKSTCLQAVVMLVNMQPTPLGMLVTFGVLRCHPPFNSLHRFYTLYHMALFLEMFLLTIIMRFVYRRKANLNSRKGEITDSELQNKVNGPIQSGTMTDDNVVTYF